MPHSLVYIHQPKKRHHHKLVLTPFDKLVIVLSAVYPLSGIPQLIAVYTGSSEGVSIWSWSIFLICSIFFLIYGVRRKVPPMIISNSTWVAVDLLVVIGLVIRP